MILVNFINNVNSSIVMLTKLEKEKVLDIIIQFRFSNYVMIFLVAPNKKSLGLCDNNTNVEIQKTKDRT